MSWFGNILKLSSDVIGQKGEDFALGRLSQENGIEAEPEAIEKYKSYVTIRVKSSRIVNVRRWTSKFYACVQSRAHYTHLEHGIVEHQTVLVPQMMKELDPSNLDAIVQIDKKILGPIPFIGELSLELGLFSIKGTDLAAPYLNLLTDIASMAGVSFASTALQYAEPLKRGADLLLGNNNQSQLEIGMDRSWDEIETGYWVLMRCPKNDIVKNGKLTSDLKIDNTDFRLVNSAGMPYRDYPYLVFEISKSRQRDDWMMISELKEAWDAIGKAAKLGEADKAEQLARQFILLCEWSTDLIPDDARRLADAAREKFPKLQPKWSISSSKKAKGHLLGEFDELALYRNCE